MKILYIAGAVVAPGSHGGATHIMEVASELAALGHELHVVCRREKNEPARLTVPVTGAPHPIEFYRLRLPQYVHLLSYPWLARLAKRLQPDVIMERYYNFAGGGMFYARRHKLPALLEVNALMVDPPGTRKHKLDGFFGRPLERWATRQCKWANAIVTPLHTTVPAAIERDKIAELPWGANVERFDPKKINPSDQNELRQRLKIPAEAKIAVFAGSFRHWHGVGVLVAAAKKLMAHDPNLYVLLLGGGPEEATLRAEVATAGLSERIILTGKVAHDKMPLYLSLADVGIAPFDTAKHAPLRSAGFFWSPLKIFEYMALALPTITIDIPPLNRIIVEGEHGLLFHEGEADDLARALQQFFGLDASIRGQMGQAARARVVQEFSWAAHCNSLNNLLKGMTQLGQIKGL
jgi:glycosyltransferase involved in cell wall biosynthesis